MSPQRVLSLSATLGLVALSHNAIAVDPVTSRIIGGDQSPNGYPWMLSMQSKDEGDHFCGASLIAERWALSAAHCIEDEPADSVFVVAGDFDLNKQDAGQQRVGVKRFVHAVGEPYGDLMLLELKEAIKHPTLPLADEDAMASLAPNTPFKVMGWGNMSSVGFDYPDKLRQTEVPFYDQADCASAYSAIGIDIDNTMMCAGYPLGGKDTCDGDSGGPMLWNNNGVLTQVGVVSFGEGCAKAGFPGVYARVATFNEWINEQMAQAEGLSISQTDFKLISADYKMQRPLTLTNNSKKDMVVQGLVLTGDNGYQIDAASCDNALLKPGASCTLNLTAQFAETGRKTATLTASSTDSSHPNWTYVFSVQSINKADFTLGQNTEFAWGQAEDGEWTQRDDGGKKSLSAELGVDKENAVLLAQFSGKGVFSFEWKIDNGEADDLYLYIDGKRIFDAKAGGKFKKFKYKLEEGQHTVYWLLQDNSDGVDGKFKRAHIRSVALNAKAKKKDNGGGGAFGFLLPVLGLLWLARRRLG
ncbi:serine protease [Hahella aquimaris]|uniref:serine protease n=1 Tax=Hahella sp. HNIBRBA332 TaxID=3015983 RepID=UPI00273CBBC8|nr:serine protease [Hahella sp. HNIBRBA332]WLQ13178.1 serine protease [Hahella sp. HNIBRBA332]